MSRGHAPDALLEKQKNLKNNATSCCFPLTVHTLCNTNRRKEGSGGGGKRAEEGGYRMQTIFLFLCHLQPLPPIPGQLLWKLHQPCSNKDKDGVRECGKMEARRSCITICSMWCSTASLFLVPHGKEMDFYHQRTKSACANCDQHCLIVYLWCCCTSTWRNTSSCFIKYASRRRRCIMSWQPWVKSSHSPLSLEKGSEIHHFQLAWKEIMASANPPNTAAKSLRFCSKRGKEHI